MVSDFPYVHVRLGSPSINFSPERPSRQNAGMTGEKLDRVYETTGCRYWTKAGQRQKIDKANPHLSVWRRFLDHSLERGAK